GPAAAAAALAIVPAQASAASASYGYVWANSPTAASYTPDLVYQTNTAGAVNTVKRMGTGWYRVSFPGIANRRHGGTVDVTAYGAGTAACQSAGWGPDGTGIVADVVCTDTNGTRVDSLFDAAYGVAKGKGALAYVWANDASSASYTPDTYYQFNAKGNTN